MSILRALRPAPSLSPSPTLYRPTTSKSPPTGLPPTPVLAPISLRVFPAFNLQTTSITYYNPHPCDTVGYIPESTERTMPDALGFDGLKGACISKPHTSTGKVDAIDKCKAGVPGVAGVLALLCLHPLIKYTPHSHCPPFLTVMHFHAAALPPPHTPMPFPHSYGPLCPFLPLLRIH